MLTFDNLPILLTALGFTAQNRNFTKVIGGVLLEVRLDTQQIIYPEMQGLVINERQTCNFSATENIVVLECVHRLLEKGYQPQHIELEPKWQLGRGASGGRADILVKDNFGKPLLIIECKTAGSEFKRAWTKTLQDGDQLFSYTQQISDTKFLCLYTSDLDGEKVKYSSYLIAHRDNEQYLADNPRFKSFGSATDVKERFAVWRDTYKLDYTTKGLFEDNIQPYHIGKDKYTLADLHAISSADQQGKYHEFATILRQHNVSGRENAFDKLVNLFLCKLVDEAENPGDLKFYWKGVAYDTHFELLDRLQQLYQSGMGRFLGEKITYINKNDVSNAMRFIRQDADATQRAVWNLFVQQKFFTNNDFSLIDVHNEKLFYQNAEILLRILQMWQDIRLSNPGSHNQFLGDMFEGFLDQGVKQSEGQYFTPMPICRFILMSLPLEGIVKASAVPPKAIDYACGAGHFLNELALQLKPLVEHHHQVDMKIYHEAIYGVEKEYRLSKVAKVSAFMYGQQDINICYGDALVKHHDAYPGIQDGSFDLLVANPPFSVRGFLETLPEADRRAYTLTDTVDKLDTANSIESFFLERAKQLLKPGGVAAIILPSSVLSNPNGTYVRAREILLQYFDIVAIAELGSGTFGKTGTNTVTLFLRRKPTSPDTAEHYRGRVAEWFKADENQPVYRDEHLIDAYAAHIGVPAADYKTLLQGKAGGAWMNHDHFEEYKKKFNDSSEVDKLSKQRAFKALSAEAKETELNKRFLINVQNIERDKIYHFVMASDQKQPVLVIRAPADSKAQKAFLGYDWSASKGDEGIKFVKDAAGQHLTPLYDESDRRNPEKLNYLIAEAFRTGSATPAGLLSDLANLCPLIDLLDFKRSVFEKQFILSAAAALRASIPERSRSDWIPLHSALTRIAEVIDPASESGVVNYIGLERIVGGSGKILDAEAVSFDTIKSTKNLFEAGDILYGKLRPNLNKVCMAEFDGICSTELLVLRAVTPESARFYLDYLLSESFNEEVLRTVAGQQLPRTSWKSMGALLVPRFAPERLGQALSELDEVRSATFGADRTLDLAQAEITRAVADLYVKVGANATIDSLSLDVQYGLSEAMNESGAGYKIFRMNEIVQRRMFDGGQMKYADISAEEFAKLKLNKGDILFNRTNSIEHVGKSGLFDLDGDYCFASYLVRVVPDASKVLPEFLVLMMNSPAFLAEARSKAAKAINQANINATVMRNMMVPVPSPLEQRRLVDQVRKLEQQIAEAQAVIAAAPARKKAILQKYL
jgi:type I restriction enzyme M protein